ncbi:MAG: hypothetical protein WD993_10370 [Thermoleophilaceae bacterium]
MVVATLDHVDMRGERGQAAVEWVAVILVAAIGLGALAAVAPVDGRSLGGLVAHRFTCAVTRACDDGDDALVRAYGRADAELVRRHLPGFVFEPGERQLPVDWRECRDIACATAADDRDLDVHRTDAGRQATVFTHLLRRGDHTYVQYWAYYPDSNTAIAGSDRLWERIPLAQLAGKALTGSTQYPGYHRDDWEGIAVRIDGEGRAETRVTSHGHWQWCKQSRCGGRWGPATGWTRVSRGSHAAHVPLDARPTGFVRAVTPVPTGYRYVPLIPGRDLHERTTTSAGIRLIPLESLPRRAYRRLDPDISPPWEKDAYHDPESSES